MRSPGRLNPGVRAGAGNGRGEGVRLDTAPTSAHPRGQHVRASSARPPMPACGVLDSRSSPQTMAQGGRGEAMVSASLVQNRSGSECQRMIGRTFAPSGLSGLLPIPGTAFECDFWRVSNLSEAPRTLGKPFLPAFRGLFFIDRTRSDRRCPRRGPNRTLRASPPRLRRAVRPGARGGVSGS